MLHSVLLYIRIYTDSVKHADDTNKCVLAVYFALNRNFSGVDLSRLRKRARRGTLYDYAHCSCPRRKGKDIFYVCSCVRIMVSSLAKLNADMIYLCMCVRVCVRARVYVCMCVIIFIYVHR